MVLAQIYAVRVRNRCWKIGLDEPKRFTGIEAYYQ